MNHMASPASKHACPEPATVETQLVAEGRRRRRSSRTNGGEPRGVTAPRLPDVSSSDDEERGAATVGSFLSSSAFPSPTNHRGGVVAALLSLFTVSDTFSAPPRIFVSASAAQNSTRAFLIASIKTIRGQKTRAPRTGVGGDAFGGKEGDGGRGGGRDDRRPLTRRLVRLEAACSVGRVD